MVLEVKNGKAGQTVSVVCGESLSGDLNLDLVGNTWGWEQQWTLRDGAQTLVQHKYVLDAVCCVYTCRRLIDLSNDCRYMECRFVSLTFSGEMALDGFTLVSSSF